VHLPQMERENPGQEHRRPTRSSPQPPSPTAAPAPGGSHTPRAPSIARPSTRPPSVSRPATRSPSATGHYEATAPRSGPSATAAGKQPARGATSRAASQLGSPTIQEPTRPPSRVLSVHSPSRGRSATGGQGQSRFEPAAAPPSSPHDGPRVDLPPPRSSSRSSQFSLDSKGLAKIDKNWTSIRSGNRRDSIKPNTMVDLMNVLQKSARRFRELRSQVQAAEDDLAAEIEGLTILHESQQEDDEEPNAAPADPEQLALDDDEVEDELFATADAPEDIPTVPVIDRLDADRQRRLRNAGLGGYNPIGTQQPQEYRQSTPRADRPANAPREPPRRNVGFEHSGFPASPARAPEDWTAYDSASRVEPPRRAAHGVIPPPAAPGLRPRRSLAPSMAVGTQPPRYADPRARAPEHDVAYIGPSMQPREMFGVQRLLDMITEMVSEEADSPPPAYLKVAKLSPPKSYDGTDDLDQFELWLRNLLEYFYTLRITGPSTDRDRLRLLSTSLEDEAAMWFYNTVQSTSREKHQWSFEEAIIGLFRRFIHRDTYLYAAQQFEQLRFDSSKGGVAALYERMLYLADRMWERPSPFQMRTRFLDALPERYENTLTVLNGLSDKYNTLSELYRAALDIEQSSRDMHARRNARGAHSGPSNATSTAKPSADSRTRRKAISPSNKPAHASDSTTRPTPSVARPGEASRPRPAGPTGERPRGQGNGPPRHSTRNPATKAAVKCFSCGQIGHFASDPECPNAGKRDGTAPRLFAQRVVDDTSDAEPVDPDVKETEGDVGHAPDEGDDGNDVENGPVNGDYPRSDYGWGGSQYDSDPNGYETPLDDGDVVHFASMRVESIRDDSASTMLRINSMAVGRDREARHGWMYDAKVRRIEDPGAQPRRINATQQKFMPTLHSSKGPRKDRFGFDDPLGVNELLDRIAKEQWEEEEIRRTHVGFVIDENEEELIALRTRWYEATEDIMRPAPDTLPPFREVDHRIPLIDEKKVYRYHLPRCAEAIKGDLLAKINRYVKAGWWRPATVPQAAPLLCVAKKNGKLRTVIDARQRNDNTVHDLTPFPDQDQIRMDVARAKYRSKIDLSDAYEQVRIVAEDIWKTAFATPFGTFVSEVMQQGDCNAPSTFQRLMTTIFRDYINRFVHVYLDDIFVYSDTIEDHERHLKLVFDALRKAQLFLSKSKCDLYSKDLDCLGHRIDDRGLHADTDKMSRIRNWRTPRSYNEVQRFLGLVNYLAHFMPDISAYTSPLSDMVHNDRPFVWRALHDKCFESIKALACKVPVLRPIDPRRPEPIWLICDASIFGIGTLYGQGENWQTCRPAGFLSKKFTSAQRAYHTYEQEALAIMEGLLKWEDKLLGRDIRIVTDHKALEFMKGVKNPNRRQIRWYEYLARFDYDITYIPGRLNKVADCLSRYYENDTPDDVIEDYHVVNADTRLDPEGDDLPQSRILELRADRVVRQSQRLRERNAPRHLGPTLMDGTEDRVLEAEQLAQHRPASPIGDAALTSNENPTLAESLARGPPLRPQLAKEEGFLSAVREGYSHDNTFNKVLSNPTHYSTFAVKEGLIYSKNRMGEEVLCLPRALYRKRYIPELAIDRAHSTLGHLGPQRTSEYVRRWFWWPALRKDVDKFCATCGTCHTVKASTKLPAGLLHSLPLALVPWTSISMDFVGLFPLSHGYDYIWVIVCRLTSMVHLIPVRTTDTAADLALVYLREVIRLHGLPESIVSDRDSKFTSKFWKELHRLMGAKLLMSTSFHPQTDGLSERTIRSITQILRAIVSPNQLDWYEKLPLAEFALNSATSATTGFAPFELNYGYLPRSLSGIKTESPFTGVREFAQRAKANLEIAHDAIIEARVSQTYHANKHRQEEPEFSVGDLVYLSTKNLSVPKGRARKLVPKFIGPYKILECIPRTSNYVLDLPAELRDRRIHPRFHVSLLRRHEANDDALFPHREARAFYDFGQDDETEWLVDEIIGHAWTGNKCQFHVRWTLGDHTWEPYEHCKQLAALDEYCQLMGVASWRALPRKPKA
ncbi:Transposon Ty3-I Gag-Pol polyprotein, partial [Trametes pubescens]